MIQNAVDSRPSHSDLRAEHIRVLERAVEDAEEFSSFGSDVRKALDYFTANLKRQGGVNLFLYGMKHGRIDCLREALQLIKKHSGHE